MYRSTNGSAEETAMRMNIPSRMTRVLVLTAGVLAAGVVAGAPQAVALPPLAASASHADKSARPVPPLRRPGCIGDSFSGTLESTKAICSDFYLVRMQPNGDLVLREIASGKACWTSRTRAPGDAFARIDLASDFTPFLEIVSASQGRLAFIDGEASVFAKNEKYSASVNNKGEFWVGFKEIAHCTNTSFPGEV
jgi:hypothetical protein